MGDTTAPTVRQQVRPTDVANTSSVPVIGDISSAFVVKPQEKNLAELTGLSVRVVG